MSRIIDFRFILTPYATVCVDYINGKTSIKRTLHYVFGFKIIDRVL